MVVAVDMAKKKSPGRPRVSEKRTPVITLKGVSEYKMWLDEFSDHCGLSIADTLGQALIEYAERRGFRPPPKR
jgi:hypothetical protein